MPESSPAARESYPDGRQNHAAILTEALADPDPEAFLVAVRTAARARGMTKLAIETGLGRESLYKALSPGAKPRYDTILKIVNALGVTLTATAIPPREARRDHEM